MRTLGLLAPVLATAIAWADGGGAWEDLAPMNVARQEVGAARIDDRVYVVGGLLAGWATSDTVEVYSISQDAWFFGPQLPAPRHHMGVAAHGGKLYVIGGYPGAFQAQDDLWIHNPAAGTWTIGAPMPEPRGALWAVTHGDRIYVFGGEDASGVPRRSTFIYDPGTDSWSQGADMPTAREHLNAASLGEFVYVVGGRSGFSASTANERYHPATDSWQSMAPLPTARSATATAAFGGRIFVMGGEVPVLQSVNEIYDPLTDSWSQGTPMPIPRHGIAAVALDDRILTPAGGVIQGLQPTNLVDSYVPEPFAGAVPFCLCGSGGKCGNHDPAAGCANSTGSGALLATCGSSSVVADDLVLVCTQLPADQFGLFFMGAGTTAVPLGDGQRCVAAGAGGLFRFPVLFSGPTGSFEQGPGIVAFSHASFPGAGHIAAGQTWNFQAWYRDGGGCGSGVNLSNALALTFTP